MPADLRVYGALGNLIATLSSGVQDSGMHTFAFPVSSLPVGTYWYVLVTPQGIESKRMHVLR
jgi:hypothetical protein